MARPSKFSQQLQQELCGYLTEGVPVSTACELVGITTETFYAWSRQGSQEDGTPLARFSDEVRRARSQGELELLRTAKGGDEKGESNGPAKCAQWMLERTRGKKYSPRINVKVEEELEVLLDVIEHRESRSRPIPHGPD